MARRTTKKKLPMKQGPQTLPMNIAKSTTPAWSRKPCPHCGHEFAKIVFIAAAKDPTRQGWPVICMNADCGQEIFRYPRPLSPDELKTYQREGRLEGGLGDFWSQPSTPIRAPAQRRDQQYRPSARQRVLTDELQRPGPDAAPVDRPSPREEILPALGTVKPEVERPVDDDPLAGWGDPATPAAATDDPLKGWS